MSVARENIEHLAVSLGIPRHEVSLIAEGHDPGKHQDWALSWGQHTVCLTVKPDDGEIQHETGAFEWLH